MHIVALLLGVLGAASVMLWRLNAAADAAREVKGAADDAYGLFRRWRWRRKLSVDLLAEIKDPRTAAAAMMAATAQSDGAMTTAERTVILNHLTGALGASPAQAEELLAHARWLVRDIVDVDNSYRRLMPVIMKQCGPAEITELTAMLEQVANADGPPGVVEQHALERFKRTLAR